MDTGPSHIGPWQIVAPLGRGGMGTVWRAVHARTGAAAAIKTITRAEPALALSIRREILALATLRHPGVVRILDQGTLDGLPWYAMEIVAGRDLRGHFAAPEAASATFAGGGTAGTFGTWADTLGGDAPMPTGAGWAAPPEALAWLARLARTLAWLHGEGVVHRDLKPDNVVIRPDGRPVLVDFGIAGRFAGAGGRESLELGLSAGGTAAYVAPEQIAGEPADARTDLYALGCILVETLTGRPPFGGSAADILRAHLSAPPEPPSSRVSGVPPEIDALALALLEKRPSRRLAYAEDAAEVLSAWDREPPDLPKPRPYLYRPALTGRAEAVAEADAALRGGERALLIGEAGIGKTRTAAEVARGRPAGGRVWTSVCAAETSAVPLGSMSGVLAALADRVQADPDGAREALGDGLPVVARAVGLPSEGPDPLAGVPGPLARARLAEVLAAAAAWMAGEAGALWLVDDVHQADASTVDVLGRVGGRVQLLCTARGEELPGSPADRLPWRRIGLDRLSDDAVGGIVGDMLAVRPPPEAVVRAVASEAAGNPFFVAEILRGAVEEGTLRRREGAWWPDEARFRAEATEPLRERLARRIAGMPAEALELATAGAVLGREVDREVAQRVAGLGDDEVGLAERELRRRYVVDEGPPGVVRFAHDRLREALLGGLEPERRRGLHRAAARALEALRPESLAERAAQHEGAAEIALARAAWREAARRAYARYADDEGTRLSTAFLRLADGPSPEDIEERVALARAQRRLGRPEALATAAIAVAEAAGLGDAALSAAALGSQAEFLYDRGDPRGAEAVFRDSLRLAAQSGAAASAAAAWLGLAALQEDLGRPGEAAASAAEAVAAARGLGDAGVEGRALSMLGSLAHLQGRTAEALAQFEAAAGCFSASGDRWRLAVCRANAGAVAIGVGRREEGRASLTEAIAVYRSLGIDRYLGSALYNLGRLGVVEARLGEAAAAFREALVLFRKHAAPAWEACAVRELGRVAWMEGLREQAWERLREAEALLSGPDVANDVIATTVLRARWHRLEGDLAAARSAVGRARASAEEAGLDRARITALAEEVLLALASGGDGEAELAALRAVPHDAAFLEVQEAMAAVAAARDGR